MDQALRHRILELETTYRSYDPATAINRLAVALAHAENRIKKLTAERDGLLLNRPVLPVDQP